jgi:hypothetical protein
MGDIDPPREILACEGEREADAEIDCRNRQEYGERLECDIIEKLTGTCQFDEANQGHDRGVLDHLNHEANCRRYGDPKGLRKNDVSQLLD